MTTEEQIVTLLKALRDEGRVMLVSTHNLGSVPEFCDRAVFVKGTVLASGKTADTFNEENLQRPLAAAFATSCLAGRPA